MRRAIGLIAFGLLLVAMTPAAQAEKRVALVIGNGAYANATQLPNPKNDAEDVAAALKREGFETIVGIDLDQAKMQDTAIAFARSAREADVALFYYSGHAMQFGGVNYLMPVDAKLSDEADLRRMARVDDILADLQQAKNLRILVLDACRDNPFAEQLKRSVGLTRAASAQRGLAHIDSPEGMIVAFSTQRDRTADDGTGRNSPYTAAFLNHIEEPGEIGLIFRRINTDVYETTQHRQLPELSLSMIGEYYLRGEATALSSSGAAPAPAPAPAATAQPALASIQQSATLKESPRLSPTEVRQAFGFLISELNGPSWTYQPHWTWEPGPSKDTSITRSVSFDGDSIQATISSKSITAEKGRSPNEELRIIKFKYEDVSTISLKPDSVDGSVHVVDVACHSACFEVVTKCSRGSLCFLSLDSDVQNFRSFEELIYLSSEAAANRVVDALKRVVVAAQQGSP